MASCPWPFLIHGARKENCFSSSRAEYRSDELGNASISVPLRFLTLLPYQTVIQLTRMFSFLPVFLAVLPSSITTSKATRRRRGHSICRLFIVRTRHPCRDAGGAGWESERKKKVRGRGEDLTGELNGKLWSGLHNKTRSSEMVRCRLGGGVAREETRDTESLFGDARAFRHGSPETGRIFVATEVLLGNPISPAVQPRANRIGLLSVVYPNHPMETDGVASKKRKTIEKKKVSRTWIYLSQILQNTNSS